MCVCISLSVLKCDSGSYAAVNVMGVLVFYGWGVRVHCDDWQVRNAVSLPRVIVLWQENGGIYLCCVFPSASMNESYRKRKVITGTSWIIQQVIDCSEEYRTVSDRKPSVFRFSLTHKGERKRWRVYVERRLRGGNGTEAIHGGTRCSFVSVAPRLMLNSMGSNCFFFFQVIK